MIDVVRSEKDIRKNLETLHGYLFFPDSEENREFAEDLLKGGIIL